jgi:hypothetical protein
MEKSVLISAINDAIASKGKNKGSLKAKCPPIDTPGAAAWNAIQFYANCYKVGMCHIWFMSDDNRAIYNTIVKFIGIHKIDVRSLDRDRKALETIGAW